MRYTDIAIIGGGLAGSTAAAMLGRADVSTVLIAPHESYPVDFRVEKLSGQEQLGRFSRTGEAESVLRRATFAGENWIARFGRLLTRRRAGSSTSSTIPWSTPSRRNPRFRRAHLRQGHFRRDQRAAAEDRALQ